MKFTALEIAEIIHSVTSRINRPDGSKVSTWNDLTDFQRKNGEDAVRRIYTEPKRTSEELHNLWMEPLINDGWCQGDFCTDKKQHPCLVPFCDLIDSEVLKDHIWSHLTEAYRDFYAGH